MMNMHVLVLIISTAWVLPYNYCWKPGQGVPIGYHTFSQKSNHSHLKSHQRLKMLIESARNVYPNNRIMQKVVVTQAVLESGWLHNPSSLAAKHNNLFGVKGKGTAGSVYMMTTEYINGKKIRVREPFAKNLSLTDSFRQHRKVLSLKRYQRVWSAKTLSEAFTGLSRGGYATDPKYPQKLMRVYESQVKRGFDE